LANRFKSRAYSDAFSTTRKLIRILATIQPLLETTFADTLHRQISFVKLVPQRILNASEEDLKLIDDSTIVAVTADVKSLVGGLSRSEDGLAGFGAQLGLAKTLRLLRSNVLSKQHEGVAKLETYFALPIYSQASLEVDPKTLIEWIDRDAVLETMLGPETHESMVLKSKSVFQFLIRHRALQSKHIDMLWSSSKRDALTRVVYRVLNDLRSQLPVDLCKSIYESIQIRKPNEYREFDVDFVRDFTVESWGNESKASDVVEFKTLEILWHVIMCPDPTDAKAPLRAIKNLVWLLSRGFFATQRQAYLLKAVGSLDDAKLPPHTVLSAIALICAFVDDQSSALSAAETARRKELIVAQMDKTYQLVDRAIVRWRLFRVFSGLGRN
jgi:hypothetical protein